MRFKSAFLAVIFLVPLFCCSSLFAQERVRGIYLTQSTLENTEKLTYLIQRAKEVGINTFVIDYQRASSRYESNIKLVHANNLNYVARIVVFPDGGTDAQIKSQAYWEKKYKLVTAAIALGASEIQLDYIRYKASQPASHQNAKNIYQVIKWFKDKLEKTRIPLQIDVFGIASFGESKHIGQNLVLLSEVVDAMCPMLYPSHYEPYERHAKQPYTTVLTSLNALKQQLDYVIPFKLYPYIEMSNYRYWHPRREKMEYIYAQIKATEDGGADGWYAWSPQNKYEYLFSVMRSYPVK